jgi:ribosomal protein S17
MKEGERNDDRGKKQKMEKEYSVQGEREYRHKIYRKSSVEF